MTYCVVKNAISHKRQDRRLATTVRLPTGRIEHRFFNFISNNGIK